MQKNYLSKALKDRAMAQAVSHGPVMAEALVHARASLCEICGGQSGTGTGFYASSWFSLSISFHRSSPYSYFTWGMNNRPVSDRGSETLLTLST
jgi:hypothetical protein